MPSRLFCSMVSQSTSEGSHDTGESFTECLTFSTGFFMLCHRGDTSFLSLFVCLLIRFIQFILFLYCSIWAHRPPLGGADSLLSFTTFEWKEKYMGKINILEEKTNYSLSLSSACCDIPHCNSKYCSKWHSRPLAPLGILNWSILLDICLPSLTTANIPDRCFDLGVKAGVSEANETFLVILSKL